MGNRCISIIEKKRVSVLFVDGISERVKAERLRAAEKARTKAFTSVLPNIFTALMRSQ